MRAHNIVSGSVTNRRDHVPARVTVRRVVKRTLIIAAVIFGVMLALGLTLNAMNGDLTSKRDEYPACEFEDGSTQAHCQWLDKDTGTMYVNHNYGEWWEVRPK